MELSVVVINLVERTDRRADMARQLAHVGWSAEFFPAIRPADAGGFPSIGARGCFMSHMAVLDRAALNEGAGMLVLLEDDVDFSADVVPKWHDAVSQLSQVDWALFYAGHSVDNARGLTEIPSTHRVVGTHFIAYNVRHIRRIANLLREIACRAPGDPVGGPMHVDGAYSTIRSQNPDLRAFAHGPALGHQRSSRSDVAPLAWYDKAPALRSLVQFGRRNLR